jgi:hypothetical protein
VSGTSGFEPIHTPPPEPRRPSWPLALIAVLVVVAAGVAVWALLRAGEPGPTPSATPAAIVSPTPTATSAPTGAPTPTATDIASPTPTATATAGSTTQADIDAEIDRIVAGIPELRELEALREVPYEFVTPEQFALDLQDLIDEETEPEQLAAEERILKRLGLLAPELDLRETILELYGSQVAAFYRPDTGRFYIIGGGDTLGAFDRMVVAHEYTHALQDQHFDLEGTRISDPSEGDAALAQVAAIEGDAVLVMLQWGFQNLSPEEMATIGDAVSPTDLELLESMPPILRRQLEFPYGEGFLFAFELFTTQFGWDAINDTLREPPATTEQILHTDKYRSAEPAIAVTLPDVVGALGSGWEESYTQTMGELNVQVWVGGGEEAAQNILGLPEQPHAEAAAGWGGDRLAMYEAADDGWAIAWDSSADADEFRTRAAELQGRLDGVSEIVPAGADRVRLLIAHDAATLAALAGAFGN